MGWLRRTGLLILMLSGGLCRFAQAQSLAPAYEVVYRPATVRYQVLGSSHFEMIFQEGAEAEAREAAAVLEATLPETAKLTGLRRPLRMPVVLNRFSDQANGYVTALPFKQVIEGVNIKGNRLSARYASWMWAVTPHELVHAAQAQSGSGFGVGAVMRWFSPDLARSLNLWFPVGMTEGAAVYRESRVQDLAGRLNFSLFQMQFRAAMASAHPWRLAQMLEAPAYSRPTDRFYIGGANVFRYLAEKDDARFFRRALGFHYRFPLLGHGVELWYGTGIRPDRLGRQFRAAMQQEETARIAALGPLTEGSVVASGPGRHYRRPRWLDDETLVAYVSGYDVRPGFYRIDVSSGRQQPISYQGITEDFDYSLSRDRTTLHFARYVRDPLVLIQAMAGVFALDLASGRVSAVTDGGRVFAPVASQGVVWALQNDGQFNQWVKIEKDGDTTRLTHLPRANFVHLAPSPVDETVAVVLHVNGRQGLFLASFDDEARPKLSPLLFFEDASVLDAVWSADGRYLLFSADLDGVANVFAYDREHDRVLRLTNVAFGAQEPSLSPDGQTLAFVRYRHERYDLVRVPFRPEAAEVVPRAQRVPEATMASFLVPDSVLAVSYQGGTVKPYRAWAHLRPRMFYPTVRYENVDAGAQDTDLGVGVGLAVQGIDLLDRWAYGAEVFYQDERAWGRATIATARPFFHPTLAVYDVPSTVVVAQVDQNGTVVGSRRVGREERGASLGLQVPFILQSNVFSTTASVSLRGEWVQERLFDANGKTLQTAVRNGQSMGSFPRRFRFTPSGLLAYCLQSNLRDLMPNTGTVLTASASVDAWQDGRDPRRGAIVQLSQYLPLSLRRHTGVRLQAGLLTQNQGSIYNLDRFLPRGYEDTYLDTGSFLRLNIDVLQPLWYIDNGFVLLPAYFKALYTYGFAATLFPLDDRARSWTRLSSVGAGLGLQVRLFYQLNLDLRVGAAYQLESRRWDVVYR